MKKTDFTPNVNIMKAFHSEVMLINDIENCENGKVLIKAGADGPAVHKHPVQDEYFKIIEGQLEVFKQDKWITLLAGQEIFIPKGTPHTYRSRHKEDCIFEYQLTPKRNFSAMMKTFERLMDENKLKGTSDLKSIIYLSLTFKKYESEVVSVSPPPFVINAMAGIGQLLGYKV